MKHRRLLVGTLIAVALALELALICAGQYASLAADGILYVDAGASGANDGTSWADAYTALQPALGAATPGSQIWVAAGTYKPSLEFWPGDPRSAAFQLKNGVALYGGFAGTENSLEERDWATHVTVLSGDLNGDDGPDFANNWDNADHVFYHPAGLNLDGTAILDGFTISGGNAYQYGGGMYNDGSSPALANCTFAGNYGGWDGGGMYNTNGSAPMLVNCAFEYNAANWGVGGCTTSSHPRQR